MSYQVLLALGLTFVIHLVSTLAYSVRIVGVRTKRIALSLALFNVLVLIARTSNSFQAPLLAKHVEQKLALGTSGNIEIEFRYLLLAATAATLVGALLIPTFQRLLSRAVQSFTTHRSMFTLVRRALSTSGFSYALGSVTIPSPFNLRSLTSLPRVPTAMLVLNALAVGFLTVGVFAPLLAGSLDAGLRTTASSLSGVVNGVATILLLLFIDPYLSALTDDVAEQRLSEPFFRRCIVLFVFGRLAGTVLAQIFLVPGAHLVAAVARWI